MSKTLYEYWTDFAVERHGTCKGKKTAPGIGGNSYRVFTINLPYRDGEITFRISEATPIKLFYNFNINLRLEFLIYHEDWMDKLGKFFGQKEYEIGIKEFDDSFIVKGSSKNFVSSIFDNQIRCFLLESSSLSNFKLETINDISVLELNAPFNESNFSQMEVTYEFLKKIIDNIFEYYENNNL